MSEEVVIPQDSDEAVNKILCSNLGEADKIRELYKLGFSRKQLESEFSFPKSTVYQTLPVKPENKPDNGKAVKQTKGHELMKIGSKDMIPPEQALRDIRLQDGDYKLGFVDGMGTLIMAARYNQILAASQAEIIKGQIDIMREAKEGTKEIAGQAAYQAGAEIARAITPELQAIKSAVSGQSGDPISKMVSMMQSAQQMMGMFGMPMGMMGPPGQPPGPPQQPWEPPPIKRHKLSEFEEEG